jgi:hypothetical protein
MATQNESYFVKILPTIAFGSLIGLGSWNLFATHSNALDLGRLTQIVLDGKEQRVEAFKQNDIDHQRIEVTLKNLEIQIIEVKSRIIALEVFNNNKKP